jgi:hypothetical protein
MTRQQPDPVRGSCAAWAAIIEPLCAEVAALQPVAHAVGVPDPATSAWHGQLFGKLRPQLSREPVLVVAVCGGTNTGKSLVASGMAGFAISRSTPEAARTRHPVASLPAGLSARLDIGDLFPGFTPRRWQSDRDAIDAVAAPGEGDDILLWADDSTGAQPPQVVLLDTPDIDGTLQENWHRAALVRNAADVIVAVLTQQKYNDAAVRDFFRAAATAGKTTVVVFNMVDWPRQRERIGGWLATFREETGIEPVAVYAAPHDGAAADAGRVSFHPLPECVPGAGTIPPGEGPPVPGTRIVAGLAATDLDRIKLAALSGSLAVVLDRTHGVEGWLAAFVEQSRAWQDSRQRLADAARVEVTLPSAPRELVWNEIWDWLEPRRSGFDLAVSRVYRWAGRGVAWTARAAGLQRDAGERREDFAAEELTALKRALGDFVARLEAACDRDDRLAGVLAPRLVSGDRAGWFADLQRRHAALPVVSEDYREFVRGELDRFARDNPGTVRWILAALNAGAVARPAITVGLGLAGAAVVPAAAATAGSLTTLVHTAGDVVVGTAATLAGEGALGLTAAGLRPLVERLFAGWSAERSQVLAESIHDVVLGDAMDQIDRLAAAVTRPEPERIRRLLAAAREGG